MMKNTFYIPITATPFKRNEEYQEVLPRNPELSKYIRCYWGSDKPYLKREKNDGSIVIPDTCVDIIYDLDYTENTISGGFCGINDTSFRNDDERECGHLFSTFAIRFYAWGAYAFAEDSLKDTVNGFYDVRSRFGWLDRMVRQQLFEKNSLEERIEIVEPILLKRLFQMRQSHAISGTVASVRHNSMVEDAVAQIILQHGAISVVELAKECFVSGRQLERLFHEYIGITPKKLCNLVRYQCLWNEIIRNPGFCVADAVYQYGYADQSHLMREFKRYHTMDINQARVWADAKF